MLDACEGYRLWAPSYAQETAVSRLDDLLVSELTPPLEGLCLLDVGCGTGRRIRDCDAAAATGVDLSPEMLDAGLGRDFDDGKIRTLVADVRALPLPDRIFDVIWCRLVIGHLPDIDGAYAELGRVSKMGATVVVTDFHPKAVAAGHQRSFRCGDVVHVLEHHVHDVEAQVETARAAGLELVRQSELYIGPEVWDLFDNAGRDAAYLENVGLPLVLGLAFRRVD